MFNLDLNDHKELGYCKNQLWKKSILRKRLIKMDQISEENSVFEQYRNKNKAVTKDEYGN